MVFKYFEDLIFPYKDEYSFRKKNIKTILEFILVHTKGVKRYLVLAAILIGVSSALEVYIFSFIGDLVDSLRAAEPESFFTKNGQSLLLFSALLIFFMPLINVFNSLINHQVLMGSFSAKLIYEIHGFLLKGNIGFFRDRPSGRIASDLMQTVQSMRGLLIKVMDVFVYVGVFWLGTTMYMAKTNLLLLLPVYIWLFSYLVIIVKFVPNLKNLAAQQASSRSSLMGFIVDAFKNIKTIKIYRNHKYELALTSQHTDSYLFAVNQQMRFISKIIFSLWAINVLLIFGVMALAIWLWSSQLVTVGEVSAAVALTLKIYSMSHWIMWETSALSENVGTLKNGVEMFQLAKEGSEENLKLNSVDSKTAVKFQEVTYSHSSENKLLENLTINIKSGESIGLVGKSGSGKSTLINLILGVYSPKKGAVCVFEHPATNDSDSESLKRIAYVSQDVELFNRSIYDNIIYGNPEAQEGDVIAAAQLVDAHSFIVGLSDNDGRTGYQVKIDAASQNLSGGQKQRIALARAVLKDSQILILDEATSALDIETELNVMKKIINFSRENGKTLIVVSHKLISLEFFDKIMLLENGELIEQGNHIELFELNGRYKEMYAKSVALC